MTLLALLRHGETQWSHDKRIQGRTDVTLNAAGRAALAGRRLPDAFLALHGVTSPLVRCIETAQLLGIQNAMREQRLAEMSWGAWEGRQLSTLRAELGDPMAANEALGFDFRPPQGESPREVLVRVRSWLTDVATQATPTLAVCHRGVIRVVVAAALGWDMRGKPPAKLDWNALHVFRLDATGQPTVLQLNVPLQERSTDRPPA
jgi:broad specificity phosphatase PhoE